MWKFLLLILILSLPPTLLAQPTGVKQVDGAHTNHVYGEWTQVLNTDAGKIRIHFNKVETTWKRRPKDIPLIEFNEPQEFYELDVDLIDDEAIVEVKTPEGKIALSFSNTWKWVEKTKNEGHWEYYAQLRCDVPIETLKIYRVMKPKQIKIPFRKVKVYPSIKIDLSGDLFVNSRSLVLYIQNYLNNDPYTLKKKLEDDMKEALAWDRNNDGILDFYQYKMSKASQAYRGGDHRPDSETNRGDKNGDSIVDMVQTQFFYLQSGMSNFVDNDGDGLCDNYKPGIFNRDTKQAIYKSVTVDLTGDVFQDKDSAFKNHGYYYYDENADGINDIFQDTKVGASARKGVPFADKNRDSIHDGWQTFAAYEDLGMNNFIDMDEDGLCDNYAK